MKAESSIRQPVLLVDVAALRHFFASSFWKHHVGECHWFLQRVRRNRSSGRKAASVSARLPLLCKFTGVCDVRQVCASLFCRRVGVVGFRRRGPVGCSGRYIRARARDFAGARSYITGRRCHCATIGRARPGCLPTCRRCSGSGFASCTCSLRQRLFSTMPVVVFAGRCGQVRPDRGLRGALRRQRSKFRWLVVVCERALVGTVCCSLAMRGMSSGFLVALPGRLGFGRWDQMQADCVIHWAVHFGSEFRGLHARYDGGVVVDVWGILALPCVTCVLVTRCVCFCFRGPVPIRSWRAGMA